MAKQGLFIGLVTLDIVYLSAKLPEKNEKIVAIDSTVAAGGPATNAAVSYSYLGNQAEIVGVLGNHPMTNLIRTDLAEYHVKLKDLDPLRLDAPPISSIFVTPSTGDRAVVSLNAVKSQVESDRISPEILANIDIVLIDGHQMAVSQKIAQLAQAQAIPVVIDGGSWKSGFEAVLPFVDYAICSANFYPPGCRDAADVFAYLSTMGVAQIAITAGENPIQYLSAGTQGIVPVKTVKAIDTLGAGDIFHGAFCHYILQQDFPNAIASAANIATQSCEFFGTRQWMEQPQSSALQNKKNPPS